MIETQAEPAQLREDPMKLLDIKVQGEDIVGMRRLRLLPGTTAAELKKLARFLRRHDSDAELLLFPEDAETPMADSCILDASHPQALSVHLHRCRHVELRCKGPGWEQLHCLSPATSFARIALLLQQQGRFSPGNTLTIAGTQTCPNPQLHLGTFVLYPFCQLALEVRGH